MKGINYFALIYIALISIQMNYLDLDSKSNTLILDFKPKLTHS